MPDAGYKAINLLLTADSRLLLPELLNKYFNEIIEHQ